MNYYSFQRKIRSNKKAWLYPAVLFVLYIIFFQFILPADLFLPKPELLIDSVVSLQADYEFLSAAGWSVLFVYSAVFLFILSAYYLGGYLLLSSHKYPSLFASFKYLPFIPFLVTAVLFALWFEHSFFGEFWILFLSVFLYLVWFISENGRNIDEKYYYIGKTYNLPEKDLYNKILWKSILPSCFNEAVKFHLVAWSYALMFEFIFNDNGLGAVIRNMYEFRDLSGIVTLLILLFILIAAGSFMIDLLKNKIVYWEAE